MSSLALSNLFRFIGIFLFQVLILKGINENSDGALAYFTIFLYPLLILLLPFKTPHWALLLIAFALGLMVDLFYQPLGLHTSALVFLAFLRPTIVKIIEPKGGYTSNQSPTKFKMGTAWFLRYMFIGLLCIVPFYFIVESLSFAHFGTTLLKILGSIFASMVIGLIYVFIFNPRN